MLAATALLALATAVAARKCHDLTIPISISARNAVFSLPPPVTEDQVTQFFIDLVRPGYNMTDHYLKGYNTISGHYNIAATYCQPDNGPSKTLQILTHGAAFDRSYWDYPFNNHEYSYVARAVDQHGYSTFSWDRLGIGRSSKGDPINEIQLFLEVAALTELSKLLRGGSVKGIDAKFDKFVHVGHSFGSAMTYSFINQNPDFSDAAVLTGFSQVPNFIVGFALGGNFKPVKEISSLAGSYPAGYVSVDTTIGLNIQFFAPGDFDPKMLSYATAHGQPATPGEILTLGAGSGNTNAFSGKVLVITGDRDLPFCGGNCTDITAIQGAYPDLIAASKPSFPNATFSSVVVPNGGHGLNLGFSAKSAYDSIFKFLETSL
ncbi:hypothetical protein M440DRAFT_1335113 [Trichoderma longibrachiatum ATCC 18648]|uniref:AB hydrolase-1 domain-containing protein n=1 Tax=Trichoderma longibrachiatum ATCC 18648 TaxID=983965 RepID=A0A2T4C2D3_TRILO|nr:hypothetical protein M440DRAFT_1335113 [Trichoderma longibrachiatum ATCC 18648]